MQSKRDYLVSKGLAKPGRGKFSNAAKEALAKAEAEGMKFADTAPVKSTGNRVEKKTDTEIKPSDPAMSEYLFPDEYRFPEAEYRGIVFDAGKKVEISLRECCNSCRVSLVNHMCDHPTIHGGITVKIERR